MFVAVSGMASTISTSFAATPTITTTKLNWKNYLSWSASSMELRFLGQGYHDHLEKDTTIFGRAP